MVYQVKELIVNEIQKNQELCSIKDTTFLQLLEFNDRVNKYSRVVILQLTVEHKIVLLKIVTQTKDSTQIDLYINDNLIGVINQDFIINKNVEMLLNIIKSLI